MQTQLSHLKLSYLRSHNPYWQTPSGRAALAWEQRILDTFAERVFGFHALTVYLPSLEPLSQSTIQQRIVLGGQTIDTNSQSLAAQFPLDDWPIQNDALDYIVLPHVLEFSQDPHAVLREAARCLRPGGSMSITAFNPHSLLGWQAGNAELGSRKGWVSRRRLIDWMTLLNLHTDRGALGQWRPKATQQTTFNRMAWMDDAGERWWPHLANVFALRVVKRLSPDLRQVIPKKDALFAKASRPSIVSAQGKLPQHTTTHRAETVGTR